MQITYETYLHTNPKWESPHKRAKQLKRSFCCNVMSQMEPGLYIPNKFPLELQFYLQVTDDVWGSFSMNFCPNCGAKVQFIERK